MTRVQKILLRAAERVADKSSVGACGAIFEAAATGIVDPYDALVVRGEALTRFRDAMFDPSGGHGSRLTYWWPTFTDAGITPRVLGLLLTIELIEDEKPTPKKRPRRRAV